MTPLSKLLFASVPLLLIGGCAVIFATSEPGQPSNSGDKITANVCAQQQIKGMLKAPSTAKFPSFNASAIAETPTGAFMVRSYVDAQNGFGAMIRTAYECNVKVSGKACNLQCEFAE